MFKINFYLNRESSEVGKHFIFCYVRERKQTLYLNTKQVIDPQFWNKDFQRANLKKTYDNKLRGKLDKLNKILDTYKDEIESIIQDTLSKKANSSFFEISDEIKKHFDKKDSGLFSVFDEFIKIKRLEVTEKTIYKFRHLKSLLEDYQKVEREKLDFNKITPLFFQKFFSFLIENKKMLNNTAHKNISFLKTFLIWANVNNYTFNNSYKSFRGKFENNEVIYLTEEELMNLYNITDKDLVKYNLQNDVEKKPGVETLLKVRDLFCFQCFTGVRFSDIENLSREDLKARFGN